MSSLSMMPTAAKLVAAIYFAALGFMASSVIFNYFAEGAKPGKFPYICIFFGLIIGYRFAGRRATGSYRAGFGNGLTTVFLISLWCLMTFGGAEMYDKATHLRYDGVMDGLKDWVLIMVDYVKKYILHVDVGALLIVGGLFGGWLTERTARAWS